jgi:hypothetical protein
MMNPALVLLSLITVVVALLGGERLFGLLRKSGGLVPSMI